MVAASAVGRRVNVSCRKQRAGHSKLKRHISDAVDPVICQCRVLPRVGSRIYAPSARAAPSVLGFRPRRSRLAQAPDAQRRPIRSCLRPEYAVGIEHVEGASLHNRLPDVPYHPLVSGHYPFPSRALQVAQRLQPCGRIRHRTLGRPASSTAAEDRCPSLALQCPESCAACHDET